MPPRLPHRRNQEKAGNAAIVTGSDHRSLDRSASSRVSRKIAPTSPDAAPEKGARTAKH